MSGEREARASRSAPATVRVVIAEDQGMVRGALAALLGLEPDFEVVGSAEDGQQAYDLVHDLRPDILLADIEMPRLSGIELAGKVADLDPAPRVVMLTTFGRSGYFQSAVTAGGGRLHAQGRSSGASGCGLAARQGRRSRLRPAVGGDAGASQSADQP